MSVDAQAAGAARPHAALMARRRPCFFNPNLRLCKKLDVDDRIEELG